MRTPAVYLADEVMPFLRARIAGILYRAGMTQSEISDYMGITQAMVSKYLAGKYKRPPEELARKIEGVAEETAKFILYGGSKEEATVLLSRRLVELFQSGFLCRFYSRYAGISEEACRSIYSVQRDRGEVLEKLSLALRSLLELDEFAKLIPEVRSNFAYTLPSPRGPEDVAAVPGRITIAKGKPYALPPEFGASSFTSGVLVELAESQPGIRSVLNIRYNEGVMVALKKAGFHTATVRTGGMEQENAITEIVRPFASGIYDLVIDEGGHGVEPMLYVFGRDPFEVVEKLKMLIGHLR